MVRRRRERDGIPRAVPQRDRRGEDDRGGQQLRAAGVDDRLRDRSPSIRSSTA